MFRVRFRVRGPGSSEALSIRTLALLHGTVARAAAIDRRRDLLDLSNFSVQTYCTVAYADAPWPCRQIADARAHALQTADESPEGQRQSVKQCSLELEACGASNVHQVPCSQR